jgi:hypothetical protein
MGFLDSMKRIGAGFGATIAAGLGTFGGIFRATPAQDYSNQANETAIVQETEMPNSEYTGDIFTVSMPDESEEIDRSQALRDLGENIENLETPVSAALEARSKAEEAKEAEKAEKAEVTEKPEEAEEGEEEAEGTEEAEAEEEPEKAEEATEAEEAEAEEPEQAEEAKEGEQAEGLPSEQEAAPEAGNDYDYDYGIGM